MAETYHVESFPQFLHQIPTPTEHYHTGMTCACKQTVASCKPTTCQAVFSDENCLHLSLFLKESTQNLVHNLLWYPTLLQQRYNL